MLEGDAVDRRLDARVEQLHDRAPAAPSRSAARAPPALAGTRHALGTSTTASRISWRKALSWRQASASPASELKNAWTMRARPRLPLKGLSAPSARARVGGDRPASAGLRKARLRGAGGHEAREELARAGLPGVARAVAMDLVAIERERGHRRGAEVVVAARRRPGRSPRRSGRAPGRPPPACRRPSPRPAPARRCRCGSGRRTRPRAGSTRRARARDLAPAKTASGKAPLELAPLRARRRRPPWCRAGRAPRKPAMFFSTATRPTKRNTGRRRSLKRSRAGRKSSVSTPRDQSHEVAEAARLRAARGSPAWPPAPPTTRAWKRRSQA